uniref:umecyanin-like n=1 Tax=Erigeron canadensis TaxID=72917 RepID=UPI001CB9626D|nr:umecyanin-like [Erigeron canadensis]
MDKVKFNMLLVIAMVVVSGEFHGSMAKEHTVGDEFGWAKPPSESFYRWWAGHETFRINDVLVFNFTNGAHTVAEVANRAYDDCDDSNPISIHQHSPVRLTIQGDSYYISTKGSDCKMGMKLSITVVSAESNISSPAPTH